MKIDTTVNKTFHNIWAKQKIKETHDRCKSMWRDEPDYYWYFRLCQEIGELGEALTGTHEHDKKHELIQIASIAWNWLDRIAELESEE